MSNDFTIVTAVTPEYLKMLYWGIGSWAYKPQLRDRPVIVYYNGLQEKDLLFVSRVFDNVRYIPWDMEGVESKSEKMFSAFVFGAARDVKTPYYMKMDADAFNINADQLWDDSDFQYDLVGHRWGYTKPGWFIDVLDNYYNGTNNPIDKTKAIAKQARIESYCCLHRTEWVRGIAAKFNGRLPVPSHDTTLWYYAEKEGKWLGKNIKARGVGNAKNAKAMREIVCSGDVAFNPICNKDLLSHVQIEITSRCNINCYQCDRNCGVVQSGPDMTIPQIWKFVEESLQAKKKWSRIDIIGGEPTLHPKLNAIFDVIKIYKNAYPRTKIRISTNGLGEKVNEVIKTIPEWVHIRNSAKEGKDQPHIAYRDAPVDHGLSNVAACSVPWRCGMGLTNNGYFPCGAGASLARVFGIDIGIKNISEVSPSAIKKQLLQLCKYCGYSNSGERKPAEGNSASESWRKAIENYKPEAMSTY